MEVYLIRKETNEVINTFRNVIKWDYNYVEYLNNGNRAKVYCDTEIEFFNDTVDNVENSVYTETEDKE